MHPLQMANAQRAGKQGVRVYTKKTLVHSFSVWCLQIPKFASRKSRASAAKQARKAQIPFPQLLETHLIPN
jgi:hypothetical protein